MNYVSKTSLSLRKVKWQRKKPDNIGLDRLGINIILKKSQIFRQPRKAHKTKQTFKARKKSPGNKANIRGKPDCYVPWG